MKPLYSNGAVTRLSADITATDTAISVLDVSNFPVITPGSEFFILTLVGNATNDVEIVQVTAVNGLVLTVVRGYQGSTPAAFVATDQAYHGITSQDASAFRDAMEYYLGAHASEPTTGRYGQPLVAGMLYYNTSNLLMREYDGTQWKQFATVISIAGLSEFLWDQHPDIAPGGPIVWPDDNGNPAPDITANDLVQVYVGGIRLQNADTPGIAAGFNVVPGTPGSVTLTAGMTGGETITVVFGVNNDNDYIDRDEADASGFGFVVGKGVAPNPEEFDEDAVVPTVGFMVSDQHYYFNVRAAPAAGEYASVSEAYAAIEKIRFPRGSATIDIGPGTFNDTSIEIDHPDGRYITIRGDSRATTIIDISIFVYSDLYEIKDLTIINDNVHVLQWGSVYRFANVYFENTSVWVEEGGYVDNIATSCHMLGTTDEVLDIKGRVNDMRMVFEDGALRVNSGRIDRINCTINTDGYLEVTNGGEVHGTSIFFAGAAVPPSSGSSMFLKDAKVVLSSCTIQGHSASGVVCDYGGVLVCPNMTNSAATPYNIATGTYQSNGSAVFIGPGIS